MKRITRYYLRNQHDMDALCTDWKEVTKQEFIKAERAAGFYPKGGGDDECATAGFGCGGGVEGKIEFEIVR